MAAVADPPPPELEDRPDVLAGLWVRRDRLPVARVRTWADLWALRRVERDHIALIARRGQMSDDALRPIEGWWLEQVDARLARIRTAFWAHEVSVLTRPLPDIFGRRRLFQPSFNTLGPGGRTWFSNRHVGIRRRTFRLRWRP
jgi:hypothetical protein